MSQLKTLVITGVTGGLGYAMVEWFATNGHTVIGCGRSASKVADMNTKFQAYNVKFSVVDVTAPEEIENWAKESIQLYGAPDFLVNNAGLTNKPDNLWDVSLEEFDKVVDINIKGVNYCIHYFLPYMIEAKKGVVVNLSSGWGRMTSPKMAPYCATKFAIEGISKALAQELPSPLVSVPLDPGGAIHTEMTETVFKEGAKMQRSPQQWAETACPFILSLNRASNGKSVTAP